MYFPFWIISVLWKWGFPQALWQKATAFARPQEPFTWGRASPSPMARWLSWIHPPRWLEERGTLEHLLVEVLRCWVLLELALVGSNLYLETCSWMNVVVQRCWGSSYHQRRPQSPLAGWGPRPSSAMALKVAPMVIWPVLTMHWPITWWSTWSMRSRRSRMRGNPWRWIWGRLHSEHRRHSSRCSPSVCCVPQRGSQPHAPGSAVYMNRPASSSGQNAWKSRTTWGRRLELLSPGLRVVVGPYTSIP